MGFEQLAPLKQALAGQAEAGNQRRKKLPASLKPAAPVDPVVLTIGQLQKRFPRAFPKNPAPKLPMKIGVHKDLLEQSEQLGLSRKALREAIKTWCRGTRYWASVVEGAVRVDLNGDEAGRVTAEEAGQARALEARRPRKPPAA
ncbi:MAG: hypothetical protein FGM62_09670 [Methylobacterium sp.]|nr:hypothetical protein [Methylobacterium sp.]